MSDDQLQQAAITEENEELQKAINAHLQSRVVVLKVEIKKLKQRIEELETPDPGGPVQPDVVEGEVDD